MPLRHWFAQAFGLHAMPKQEGGIVIWTTTPWTIPANQALNVHPEIVYSLVDTEKGLLILAEDRVEECLKQYSLTGSTIATTMGATRALPSVLPMKSQVWWGV